MPHDSRKPPGNRRQRFGWTNEDYAAHRERLAEIRARVEAEAEAGTRELYPRKRKRTKRKRISDEQIIASLRVWLEAGGDGTQTSWNRERDPASTFVASIVARRFGTWSAAVREAGGRPTRDVTVARQRFDDRALLTAMITFLSDPSTAPGHKLNYRLWRRRQAQSYPASDHIARQLGGWKTARIRARRIMLGRDELPPPAEHTLRPKPGEPCSSRGCEEPVVTNGLCNAHAHRLRARGRLDEGVPVRPSSWSDADLLAAVRTFVEHAHTAEVRCSATQYTAWRKEQPAPSLIPSLDTVVQRFTWSGALSQARSG